KGGDVQDMAFDFTHGDVFVTASGVESVFGQDVVNDNYIYEATGLTSGSGANSLGFGAIPFSPNDSSASPPNNANIPPLPGNAFPVEHGTLGGIDLDPATQTLYFTTASVSLDISAAQDGSQFHTFFGGVFKYSYNGNPSGTYTTLFQQDGTNGPTGLLGQPSGYIAVDPVNGKYYVDEADNSTHGMASWVGSTSGGTPTLFADITNVNGLGPEGLTIDHAPTLTLTPLGSTPSYTENQASTPSPAGTPVALISSASASDADTVNNTVQLAGAVVRISSGFLSGASHQDLLVINGTTSGTLDSGKISYSYDSTTGAMVLSGADTFAQYQSALALVKYTSSGDNPDNFGADTSRTISWSVSDGLLSC